MMFIMTESRKNRIVTQKQFRIISINILSRKQESLGIGLEALRSFCRFLSLQYRERLSVILKTDETTIAFEQIFVFLSIDQPHCPVHKLSIEAIL